MATLQVRGVPEHVYRLLQARAERRHRSVSQETIAILETELATRPEARERREAMLATFDGIRLDRSADTVGTPAELIRADRDR